MLALKLFPSNKKNDNSSIPVNNTITFWIGNDGIPYAKIYIVDTNDKSVEPLAELLFGINTGEYMNYMLNILIHLHISINIIIILFFYIF